MKLASCYLPSVSAGCLCCHDDNDTTMSPPFIATYCVLLELNTAHSLMSSLSEHPCIVLHTACRWGAVVGRCGGALCVVRCSVTGLLRRCSTIISETVTSGVVAITLCLVLCCRIGGLRLTVCCVV